MSWRDTAKLYAEKSSSVVFEQLDRLDAQLEPGDWVQVAGEAVTLEHGQHRTGSRQLVYMITTKAIYATSHGMIGKWKDIPPIPVTDIPRWGLEQDGVWTSYIGDTPTGRLALTVSSNEQAEDIAHAVKVAFMHQTQGFPLFAPGSPEAAGNNTDVTAQRAGAATADGLHALVDKFRESYRKGDSAEIWNQRCVYGYAIDGEQFDDKNDWFWFNAYPALSGLNLGKARGAPLSTFCGLAEDASNRNDPEQHRATEEIKQRYFMKSR